MAGYIGSKASVVSNGAERKKVFDITTTTTSLTGCSYTPNQVHIFHNGVRLVQDSDFTATDGSTITLTNAAQAGDEVVVVSYATFQTSDTVSASAGGTFSNAVTIDANGATVLTVDRATSDGTIIDLQKDGSSVGSVGAATASGVTSIYAGNDDTALWFRNGIDAVTPFSITGNSTRDAAIDFGQAGGRFKDLYLSGGVYLGGTGAVNYLDDYEEGTWTPSFSFSTGSVGYADQQGLYVKTGNLVFWNAIMVLNSISGANGAVSLTGLPFTNTAGERYVTAISYGLVRNLNTSYTNMMGYNIQNSTDVVLSVNSTTQNNISLSANQFTASTLLYVSGTYRAA